MNQLIHFTGGRKIMNMAKLGIVSRSLKIASSLYKPRLYWASGVTRYTLCDNCIWMGWSEMLIKSNETDA